MRMSLKKYSFRILCLILFLVAGTTVSVNALNSPDSGYLLCVNSKTKVVTYPNSTKCPSGALGVLVAGASGSASGQQGDEVNIKSVYAKVKNSFYQIQCNDLISTGTGIDITLADDISRKGYRGALITSYPSVRECENQRVITTQDGNNYGGFVYLLDPENNLALVVTSSKVNYLHPANRAPETGDFALTIRTGNNIPERSLFPGYVSNNNVFFDETFFTFAPNIGQSATVLNRVGDFINIAGMKPGVLCRELLTCKANSDLLIWSK